MKNVLLVLLLATTIAFGALWFRQGARINRDQTRIAALEESLKDKDTTVAEAMKAAEANKKAVEELRTRLNESALTAAAKTRQADQVTKQLAAAQSDTARAVADAKRQSKSPLSEMFSNPEMKDMIKSQQKLVLGPMVDKLYGKLFKDLNLNEDQKGQLKDMVMKKMLVASESGMELLSGDLDPAKREEIGKKIQADMATYDKQIKEYLGDQYYTQFQQYEKTQGERMQLDQFRDQLSSGSTALSADQEQRLLQAMIDQQTAFKWTTDYSDQTKLNANMTEYFTDDRMAKFADEKLQYDQQMLARAQQVLTPEQYAAYEKFIVAQRQMQIAGLKMAAQMFGAKK